MSIHPGFPDLSPRRRNALMTLIDEIKDTRDVLDAIRHDQQSAKSSTIQELAALVDNFGTVLRLTQLVRECDRLAEIALYQFPECRGGGCEPQRPMTNGVIGVELHRIRWHAADAIGEPLGYIELSVANRGAWE